MRPSADGARCATCSYRSCPETDQRVSTLPAREHLHQAVLHRCDLRHKACRSAAKLEQTKREFAARCPDAGRFPFAVVGTFARMAAKSCTSGRARPACAATSRRAVRSCRWRPVSTIPSHPVMAARTVLRKRRARDNRDRAPLLRLALDGRTHVLAVHP